MYARHYLLVLIEVTAGAKLDVVCWNITHLPAFQQHIQPRYY